MSDDDLPEVDTGADGVAQGTCEFCGRKYWIDGNNYSVIHELPICLEYETLDILDYCVKNREIKERKVVRA